MNPLCRRRKTGKMASLASIAQLDRASDYGLGNKVLPSRGGQVIRGCGNCNTCMKLQNRRCSISNDPVNDIIAKMAEADGIILGSPVYFTDVTPELKALIDRSGRVAGANGQLFKRKVGAGVIAVRRGGATHALDTIYHFLHITQMIIPGAPYWNFGIGRDVGDVEKDAEGVANMKGLGENIAWLLKKIHA